MNSKRMYIRGICIFVFLMGVMAVGGCKKSEPEKPVVPNVPQQEQMQTEESVIMEPNLPAPEQPNMPMPEQPNVPTDETVGQLIEQTDCPVMSGPIDKNIFTEYQGKKVYFCCMQCKAEFEKEPEKYISTLPQFQK